MQLTPKEIIQDILWDEVPEIELYADQIITLLNQCIPDADRRLTKSMINNYSKAKILGKIRGRKYTKSHVIMIAIINRLKQTLTINEIKFLIDQLHDEIYLEEDTYRDEVIENIYCQYIDIFQNTFNQQEKMQSRLQQVSGKCSLPVYVMIEALCLSALAQSYQEKIRTKFRDMGY